MLLFGSIKGYMLQCAVFIGYGLFGLISDTLMVSKFLNEFMISKDIITAVIKFIEVR